MDYDEDWSYEKGTWMMDCFYERILRNLSNSRAGGGRW